MVLLCLTATTAEKERVAFADKDTPEVAQLKLDLLRIAALTGRWVAKGTYFCTRSHIGAPRRSLLESAVVVDPLTPSRALKPLERGSKRGFGLSFLGGNITRSLRCYDSVSRWFIPLRRFKAAI